MSQTIAERTAATVRAELARRRISGLELARKLGWSAAKTQRRLAGTQAMDVDELAAIAAVIGVSVSTLLPGRDAA